jgi:ATP-dependent DNA ligase
MITPQLLTDCQDPEPLFRSNEWLCEEKLDGDRCVVEKRGNIVRAFSRNGREMALNDEMIALAMLSECDFDADGEMMPGGEFIYWAHRGDFLCHFKHVRFATSEQEKRELAAAVKREGGEGVVFKRIAADYAEGRRSPDWQRWKYYDVETFTVRSVDLAKCSVEVEKDGRSYGRVACSLNSLPVPGQTIRVRFDKVTDAGKLLRARLIA